MPYVRDTEPYAESPIQSYQAMKRTHEQEELTDAILLGLEQGDYERVAGQFIDGFGLSQPSMSRRIAQGKSWHHSRQQHRWVALVLLETEDQMHRLAKFGQLPALQEALQEYVREPTSTQHE